MSAELLERLYRLTVDASQANRQLRTISKSTQRIERGFGGIQRAAAAAFAAFSAFKSAGALVQAADDINLLEGSFEALTGSGERATGMLQDVFNTVSETGASLKDVGTTFQRLTIGLEELGATNEEINTVANTFIKLGRVSGTSMFETNSALVQFSQGLATGRLQGDELRSIMERLPLITRLIQQEWNRVNVGMEISRGEVKQLGKEGKISAEIMLNALLNGAKLTEEQFRQLTFTLEQENNRLFASLRRFAAEFAEVTGIDDAVKDSIRALASTIDDMRSNMALFVRDMKKAWEESYAFNAILITISLTILRTLIPAIIRLGKVLRRNPLGLALTVLSVGAVEMIANWEQVKLFFEFKLPSVLYSFGSKVAYFMSDLLKSFGLANDAFETLGTEWWAQGILLAEDYAAAIAKLQGVTKDPIEIVSGRVKDETAIIKEMRRYMVLLETDSGKFVTTLREANDPLREIERTYQRLVLLSEEGFLNLEIEEIDKYINALLKKLEKSQKGINNLMADLTKAGNSFIESFSTGLADALVKGEMNFGEFATAILNDLARMLLRAILFNSIMSGLSGTQFGDWLGVSGNSGGGGYGPPTSLGVLATSTAEGAVGVLRPKIYGFGANSSAVGGYGNVTVNNYTDSDVSVEQRTTDQGIDLDILIEKKVNQSINSGGLDRTLQSNFGLARRAF